MGGYEKIIGLGLPHIISNGGGRGQVDGMRMDELNRKVCGWLRLLPGCRAGGIIGVDQ